MADKGKLLENKFARWMKEYDIYYQRFYDARSFNSPNAPTQPADFWVWVFNKLIFIECKECKGKALSFKSFRPSQYQAYFECEKHKIRYLALVNINNTLFIVKMGLIVDEVKLSTRKSLPFKWFETNAVKITKKDELLSYFNNS